MKENLRKIRKENGYTQKEIAEKLNITRSTYNNYEQGVAEPSIQTLKTLANIFNITVDYLTENKIPYMLDKSTLTAKQKNIVELLPKLNDRICEKVEAYIFGLIEGESEQENIKNYFNEGL